MRTCKHACAHELTFCLQQLSCCKMVVARVLNFCLCSAHAAASATALSLTHSFSAAQVATFLQADPQPWAGAFCAALAPAHPQLATAQQLLGSLSSDGQWALLRFHPALQRPVRAGLRATLAAVPAALHAAAVVAHHGHCQMADEQRAGAGEGMLDSAAVGGHALAGIVLPLLLPSPSERPCRRRFDTGSMGAHLPRGDFMTPAEAVQLAGALRSTTPGTQGLQLLVTTDASLDAICESRESRANFVAPIPPLIAALVGAQLQHLTLELASHAGVAMSAAVMSALPGLSMLRALHLNNVDLSDSGSDTLVPALLAMPSLHTLALERCRSPCLAELAEALPTRTALRRLSCTDLLRRPLLRLPTRRECQCGTGCEHDMLQALGACTWLQALRVSLPCRHHDEPPSSALQLLWGAPAQRAEIDVAAGGPSGAEAAQGQQSLQDLEVSICATDLAHMPPLAMLTALDLYVHAHPSQCGGALGALAQVVGHMAQLRSLQTRVTYGGCWRTDESESWCEDRAPASMFAACTALRTLRLGNLWAGREGAAIALPAGVQELQMTSVGTHANCASRVLSGAGACTALRKLQLGLSASLGNETAPKYGYAVLAQLACEHRLQHVTHLALRQRHSLRDRTAVFLSKSATHLSGALRAMPSLEHFELDIVHGPMFLRAQADWAAFAAALAAPPRMRSIAVAMGVADRLLLAALSAACRAIPGLQSLRLSVHKCTADQEQGCDDSTRLALGECARALAARCPKLRSVHITAAREHDEWRDDSESDGEDVEGGAAVADCLLPHQHAQRLIETLAVCPELTELNLKGVMGRQGPRARPGLQAHLPARVRLSL